MVVDPTRVALMERRWSCWWWLLVVVVGVALLGAAEGRRHRGVGHWKRSQDAASSSWTPAQEGSAAGGRLAYADVAPSYAGAYIEAPASTRVVAQNGSHAYLPCSVKRLGSKLVSWIRKADGHMLTVARDTFITDSRFEALHQAASDVWTLHLRQVRPDDAGDYECQVSTEPKTSLLFHLDVITPHVEVRGWPDVYVKSGSRVELQCQLSDVLDEPPFIFWYFDGQRLVDDDQESEWPRVVRDLPDDDDDAYDDDDYEEAGSVTTPSAETPASRRRGVKSTSIVRLGNGSLTSLLTISSASADDAGRYECRPSNMAAANVSLHVLDGQHEEPAAAVQDGASSSARWRRHSLYATASLLFGASVTMAAPFYL